MKSAISKWMNRFKEGRDTTNREKRKGRPVTVSNERKVAEIQEYILEDRRVTVENVAEHFQIGTSYGTAHNIMSNKLGKRHVSARSVPRLLLPEQMGVRVRMCNEYCRQYNDEGDTFLNQVGWSGGAMVLGKLPVSGRPTILVTVGQGPIALAVGAGGGGLDIFTLIYPFSSFSLPLGDGPI